MVERTDTIGRAFPQPAGRRPRNVGRWIWRFIRTQPLGAAGAAILLVMALLALFANQIVPYDPLLATPSQRLQSPSLAHWFGTDNLGRDMLSRVVWASRPSLFTGIIVVTFTGAAGLALGITSAYLGGAFDLFFQRFIDAMQAFPGLILAMVVVSVLGNQVQWDVPWSVVVALGLAFLPNTCRVIRSAALTSKYNVYIEAARAVGASHRRIIFRHIAPNVMGPAIVIASVQLGTVILAESSLSFLNLGVAPPTPSWGGMLSTSGRRFMETAPWLAIFPGIAISLAVLAFNLLGDSVQDVLDPRLRGSRTRPRF